MKILLILLLPFASFSQTGAIPSNASVTISFETMAGITDAWIRNDTDCKSEIEFKINGLSQSKVFEPHERFSFQLLAPDFKIEARNLTCGSSEWVVGGSNILAVGIKVVYKKTIKLQSKIQCDEIPPTPSAPVLQ